MKKHKYELTNETITIDNGKTLYRIRALIDIEALGVNIGDLGGYIEKEYNLSHDCNAWVSDNAMVYGDAWVSDNAWVYGDARIYGYARIYGNATISGNAWVSDNAWVYGDARIYGDAMVYGDAKIYGNAMVYGDAKIYGNADIKKVTHILMIGPIGSRNDTTFFRTKENIIKVKCGCFYGTIDEFLVKVEITHGNNKYGQVYRLAAEFARAQIKLD